MSAGRLHLVCALVPGLLLAGCSDGSKDDSGTPAPLPQASAATLASAIAAEPELSGSAHLLNATGLIQVFDGAGSYTILAPGDAALDARYGSGWQDAGQRTVAADMLRDHILPGYITPADIEDAIARQPDGSARMRSLGDGIISFTMERGRLIATDAAGHSARIGQAALLASNGVALPLDGILASPPPPRQPPDQ